MTLLRAPIVFNREKKCACRGVLGKNLRELRFSYLSSKRRELALLCAIDLDADIRFGPRRTHRDIGYHAFGHPVPITILPYHPLLVSLADSEVRLQATLTARSQGAPPCGRHQRTMWESSLVVLKALQALAGRT